MVWTYKRLAWLAGSWLCLGLGLGPLTAGAQTAAPKQAPPLPLRFGQPDPADLEAQGFAADSGAVAVVLYDVGQSRFASVAGHMAIITERTTRIKILKKAGYAYATVEVPLYHQGESSEKLSNLRGFTYVRGDDGQVTKTKLDASGVFEEKRTDKLQVQKFTLPNVQEGAVIEYAYTVTSTFFSNFQSWTFQAEIPVRWSEYRTSIPQVYHYKALYQGYLPFAVNEMGVGSVSMILENKAGTGLAATSQSQSLSMSTEQHRWVIRNAPAFREEPYLTTAADYLARLTFELAGVQMPNEQYRDLTDSWTKKNKALLDDEWFGQALEHADFLAAAVRPLVAQYPEPAARAAAVRALVLSSVKYDGTNRYHATGPLKKAYELHRGTSADVNLLLIAALRQAELPAQPVILSTRAHGRVSQEYPLLEQFNYVVALLETPGQPDLLLDATEPLLPAGELPRRCLSRIGHTVVTKGEGRWVSLTPSRRYTHMQNIKLTLHAPGDLTGEVQEEYGGYAALEAREQVQQLGEKKYVAQLPAARAGWEVPAYSFSKLATVDQPLGLRYELHQAAAGSPQELYLKLLEPFGERRNPFRYAQRRYPVDIGLAQQEIIMLTLTLPPGYVADLPKSANLLLPEQGGRYLYQASAPAPNTVQLISRLTLDKAVYSPDEYQALRELYRQLLAKQAEALVVRKAQ